MFVTCCTPPGTFLPCLGSASRCAIGFDRAEAALALWLSNLDCQLFCFAIVFTAKKWVLGVGRDSLAANHFLPPHSIAPAGSTLREAQRHEPPRRAGGACGAIANAQVLQRERASKRLRSVAAAYSITALAIPNARDSQPMRLVGAGLRPRVCMCQ